MIRIRAFHAVADPISCRNYIEGHRKILEVYGVTKVTSANTDWVHDPNVYVIIVESKETGKTLGGARIQVAGGANKLPIVDAVTEKDPNIHRIIEEFTKEGTGELCGLWNSREVAGLGIGSVFLTRSGVSIANQLNIKSIFALCASYTVKMAETAGFRIETTLGVNGTFYYPKEDFLATALILKDVEQLSLADPLERGKILELRDNPRLTVMENGRWGPFELEYDLVISKNK